MSKLIATRYAQPVMEAEFTFNFDDTMVNVAGATVDFGKTTTGAVAFDVINLPIGAVVVDGHLVTETAFDTASYAVTVGDAAVANRYLASVDRKGAGVSALTATGFRVDGPVRLSVTNADVCTAGKATLRVQYVVPGRGTENSF